MPCSQAAQRHLGDLGSAAKRAMTPLLMTQLRGAVRATEPDGTRRLRDWTAYVLMYLGLFRVSEVVALRWSDIEIDPAGIRVTVRSSKASQFAAQTVFLAGHPDPVYDLRGLLPLLRGAAPPGAPVLAQANGCPLVPDTIRSRLRTYLSAIEPAIDVGEYSTHSFRRGGATAMARKGIPVRLIKLQGRWKSDAVNVYITSDTPELLEAAQLLAATLQ